MTNYTTVATITKIEKADDNKSTLVYIRGFGQYFHEDSKKQPWNILEQSGKTSQLLPIDTFITYKIPQGDFVFDQLAVLSMFHKKPVKLTIKEESGAYTITAIEVE